MHSIGDRQHKSLGGDILHRRIVHTAIIIVGTRVSFQQYQCKYKKETHAMPKRHGSNVVPQKSMKKFKTQLRF